MLIRLTVCDPSDEKLVHEGYADAKKIQSMSRSSTRRARNSASRRVVEVKISLRMTMLFGVAPQVLVDADEVILELTSMVVNVLFLFEMRQQFVEKEQVCFGARNGTAQASQVVQLAECSSEGRLAPLIGSGDDKDLLATAELELIGDDRRVFADEFVR